MTRIFTFTHERASTASELAVMSVHAGDEWRAVTVVSFGSDTYYWVSGEYDTTNASSVILNDEQEALHYLQTGKLP